MGEISDNTILEICNQKFLCFRILLPQHAACKNDLDQIDFLKKNPFFFELTPVNPD